MKFGRVLFGLALCGLSSAFKAQADSFAFNDQSVKGEHTLMAIAFAPDNSIWVSGAGSSIYYSQDNGANWKNITPPTTAEPLEFRDIEILPDGTVLLMSAGSGDASRVFRSNDKGASWAKVLQAKHPNAFFDCMAFVDAKQGWLYGDSIEGKLYFQKTSDGGKSWQAEALPFDALKDEGGFASSGTCIQSDNDGAVIVGTGNGKKARLLVKDRQWQMSYGPLKAGKAAGIFSVQRKGNTVFSSGGSLNTPDLPAQVFQYTLDKKRWRDLGNPRLKGAIYGSALVNEHLMVSNPNGVSAYNLTSGEWEKINDSNVWALACRDETTCWGSGAKGNIVRLTISKP